MSIIFKEIEGRQNLKSGEITFENIGKLPNIVRRVLLDEIPTVRFCVKNSVLKTTDKSISNFISKNLTHIRIYSYDINDSFYIKIKSNGNEPIKILSDHIINLKNNKPADVQKNIEICELSAGCEFFLNGITLIKGTGASLPYFDGPVNSCFSEVVGLISYLPYKITFVNYMNKKGFIEENLRIVNVGDKYKTLDGKEKKFILGKEYLIWNEEGSAFISEIDKRFSELKEIILYDGDFIDPENTKIKDIKLTFLHENPKEAFIKAVEIIRKDITREKLSKSAGELLTYYCLEECDCSVCKNINDSECTLNIVHTDSEKIKKNAIEKIHKILDNI